MTQAQWRLCSVNEIILSYPSLLHWAKLKHTQSFYPTTQLVQTPSLFHAASSGFDSHGGQLLPCADSGRCLDCCCSYYSLAQPANLSHSHAINRGQLGLCASYLQQQHHRQQAPNEAIAAFTWPSRSFHGSCLKKPRQKHSNHELWRQRLFWSVCCCVISSSFFHSPVSFCAY
jgi:hypothetical protein